MCSFFFVIFCLLSSPFVLIFGVERALGVLAPIDGEQQVPR